MDIVPKENLFEETVEDYTRSVGIALSDVARMCQSVNKVPKEARRNTRLLDSIQVTFELMGGIPRLALWADANPGDFYKLMAKQIPGMVQQLNFNGPTQINITPSLPRSPLDAATESQENPESGSAGG